MLLALWIVGVIILLVSANHEEKQKHKTNHAAREMMRDKYFGGGKK